MSGRHVKGVGVLQFATVYFYHGDHTPQSSPHTKSPAHAILSTWDKNSYEDSSNMPELICYKYSMVERQTFWRWVHRNNNKYAWEDTDESTCRVLSSKLKDFQNTSRGALLIVRSLERSEQRMWWSMTSRKPRIVHKLEPTPLYLLAILFTTGGNQKFSTYYLTKDLTKNHIILMLDGLRGINKFNTAEVQYVDSIHLMWHLA